MFEFCCGFVCGWLDSLWCFAVFLSGVASLWVCVHAGFGFGICWCVVWLWAMVASSWAGGCWCSIRVQSLLVWVCGAFALFRVCMCVFLCWVGGRFVVLPV